VWQGTAEPEVTNLYGVFLVEPRKRLHWLAHYRTYIGFLVITFAI
jgi:hypothetical protein